MDWSCLEETFKYKILQFSEMRYGFQNLFRQIRSTTFSFNDIAATFEALRMEGGGGGCSIERAVC